MLRVSSIRFNRRAHDFALRWLSAAAIFGCVVSCTAPESWQPEELARYEGGTITATDLDLHLRKLPEASRRLPESALQSWLDERLFEVFIGAALPSTEEARELESTARYEQLFEQTVEQELARRFTTSQNAKFEVSPEEIAAEFERQRASIARDEQRLFRSLYLAFDQHPARSKDEVCEFAAELAEQTRGGSSFESLVKRHSNSAGARLGGGVGPVPQSALQGEIGRIVFSLEPGKVSEPVRTSSGCFLFYLVQVQPAIVPELGLMQAQIAESLAQRQRAQWRLDLMKRASADLNLDVPAWLLEDDRASVADLELDPDAILVRTSQRTLRIGDIQVNDPGFFLAAAREQVASAVFAEAGAGLDPAVTATVKDGARASILARLVQEKKIAQARSDIPTETLQTLFNDNKESLVTDARLELEIYSWPIEGRDATQALRQPRAFLAEARKDAASIETLVSAHGNPFRTTLPETGFAQLRASRPELKALLAEDLTEGAWLGPSRVGPNLLVAHVVRFLPSRPLSFVEAAEQLRQRWITENQTEFTGALRDRMAERFDFRTRTLDREALATQLALSSAQSAGGSSNSTPNEASLE